MTKNNCEFCGNNQVPHGINWYFESLNILLTPVRQVVLYNPVTSFLVKSGLTRSFSKITLAVAEGLKIITRQPDVKKCKVRRAQVLWEEAEKRGIQMQELLLFGKPFDVYLAEKNHPSNPKLKVRLIFSGLPRPAGYFNPWLDLMDDKWKLKEKFLQEGLPVPLGASCFSFQQAKKIFEKICSTSSAVIVKPRAGSRGRHSTTFVSSSEDLKVAFKVAKQLCFWVMVEEQLQGPVYRATVINFKLAGVLRGDAPQILGDGIHTIAQLIESKNLQPHPGVKNIPADRQVQRFLARQHLTLESILPVKKAVALSEKIGVNYGGSSEEDLNICHPENIELFERAAKILGDPVVGFDFIVPDISKSFKVQKCGFIEVNSLPFINLHHDPLLGAPQNVASAVWDMLNL
jgi:D-alanine-D-alanine ligase-like ATP-grasp enzyme